MLNLKRILGFGNNNIATGQSTPALGNGTGAGVTWSSLTKRLMVNRGVDWREAYRLPDSGNKLHIIEAVKNGTTLQSTGANAPILVGTATVRNVGTAVIAERCARVGYVSAATAGALASLHTTGGGVTTGSGVANSGSGFSFNARFILNSDAVSVTGARAFVGLSSSTAGSANVEPTTLTNAIGVAQMSNDTSQLRLIHAGSTAQAGIPLGVAFPPTVGVLYELSIFCPESENGVVYVSLENVSSGAVFQQRIVPASIGVGTPAATTLLVPRAWRTNNTTAQAVGLDIAKIVIETRV